MDLYLAANLLKDAIEAPGYPNAEIPQLQEALEIVKASNAEQIEQYTDYYPGDLVAESSEIISIALDRLES